MISLNDLRSCERCGNVFLKNYLIKLQTVVLHVMCGKKNSHINWNKTMSIRCKVYNATKITMINQFDHLVN